MTPKDPPAAAGQPSKVDDRSRREGPGYEVVRIGAGTLAVRCLRTGEVMHPGVGPRAEAEILYVRQSKLAERLCDGRRGVVVFDVGLGAGANALAARAASERAPAGSARLELVSFERDLRSLELTLAHGGAFGYADDEAQAMRALLATGRHETSRTTWRLTEGDALTTIPRESARADVVFWDPFSTRSNPELWTESAFATIRSATAPRGALFTYSSSTLVRASLLLAGWIVGAGDAVGSKVETTAAAVSLEDVRNPLGARWLERLRRSGVALAPEERERVAACRQFSP